MTSPALAYVPEFMRRWNEFTEERARVRTVGDWRALVSRWFDPTPWPVKTPAQLGAESMHKRSLPPPGDGRTWLRSCHAWDITPEARYQMASTIATLGDPLRFPHLAAIPKAAGSGWRQACPYCEISTGDLGRETCPECGRPLIYTFASE